MKKILTLASIVLFTAMASVHAQNYPNKPIRLIVPYPPGAGTDISARIMAEALGPKLGQPVVVENRAGAGGLTGMDYVAKAAADGYTLGWPSADPMVMVPAVKKTMPYRVPADFSYIAKFTETGFVFVISSNLPVKTLAEFIAYAKSNPGKLKYGTTGVAGAAHLASLIFENHAGVKMTHIPYRGMAPALTDLLGGHLDMCLITPSTSAPHANNDKLRLLAVTSSARHPLLPNVPTMAEAGLPSFGFSSWWGLVGPAGLPAAVQERLRKAVAEVVDIPAVKEKVAANAMQIAPLFGNDFEKLVVKDLGAFKALADAEKLVVEE